MSAPRDPSDLERARNLALVGHRVTLSPRRPACKQVWISGPQGWRSAMGDLIHSVGVNRRRGGSPAPSRLGFRTSLPPLAPARAVAATTCQPAQHQAGAGKSSSGSAVSSVDPFACVPRSVRRTAVERQFRYELASVCRDSCVHVNRVNVWGGASPPGRSPRRTKRTGGASTAVAIARRVDPTPRCANDPIGRSRAGGRRPRPERRRGPPGGIRTGSVTMPTTCCTSSEARASSLLASRRPSAGSASVPSRRRLVPSAAASQAASSIADQSCSVPPNGVTMGPPPAPAPAREEADLARGLLEQVGERLARAGLRPSSSGGASARTRSTGCSAASRAASAPGAEVV